MKKSDEEYVQKRILEMFDMLTEVDWDDYGMTREQAEVSFFYGANAGLIIAEEMFNEKE